MKYIRENIKGILLCIGLSFIYASISLFLKDNLLWVFLKKDFLTLLIALFAIYIPTIAVILGKLDTLQSRHPYFEPTMIIPELVVFVKEIMTYVTIVIVVMVTYTVKNIVFEIKGVKIIITLDFFYQIILFTVFSLNIRSLYDLCRTLIALYENILMKGTD